MKSVRLKNGIVQEIIPDYALPVEDWYGTAFAAQCVDAPDEVEQGWEYDQDAGTFSLPSKNESKPAPTPEEDAAAFLVDHEYRITLLELGVI